MVLCALYSGYTYNSVFLTLKILEAEGRVLHKSVRRSKYSHKKVDLYSAIREDEYASE